MYQRPTYVDMSQLNQRYHNWLPLTGLGAGDGSLGGSALGNPMGATSEYPPLLVTKWFRVPTATWQQMSEGQQADLTRQAQQMESGYQSSLANARAAQINAYNETLNTGGAAVSSEEAAVSSAESAVLAAKKCDRASMDQLITYSTGLASSQVKTLEAQSHAAARQCADVASAFPNEQDIVQRAGAAIDAANQTSSTLAQAEAARTSIVSAARKALASCGGTPLPVESCGKDGQSCPCCDGYDCVAGKCIAHLEPPHTSQMGMGWWGILAVAVGGTAYALWKQNKRR